MAFDLGGFLTSLLPRDLYERLDPFGTKAAQANLEAQQNLADQLRLDRQIQISRAQSQPGGLDFPTYKRLQVKPDTESEDLLNYLRRNNTTVDYGGGGYGTNVNTNASSSSGGYSPGSQSPDGQKFPGAPSEGPGKLWDSGGVTYEWNGSSWVPKQQNPQDQAQNMINSVAEQYQKQYDQYKSRLSEFDQKNPFVFDQVLQEEQGKVAQRLDPYYNQTLSDFLRGIDVKRKRSLEDERNLVSELQADTDAFEGKAKMDINKALEGAREGFEESGLYSSGKRFRAEGEIQASGQEQLSDVLQGRRKQIADIGLRTRRGMEDLGLTEELRRRDIERERQYQTQSQSLGEAQRRQREREFERLQYAGLPPGVEPQQFNQYSYNLLGA